MSDGEQNSSQRKVSVDVVIPVYNEAHVLESSLNKAREYLKANVPYQCKIIIVDNGSIDGTTRLAQNLSQRYDDVHCIVVTEAGRGRALRQAWMQSSADYSCYFDVDLSTDLNLIPALLNAVIHEGYDIAIGSRLMAGARIQRSLTREIISRVYNILVRNALSVKFSDTQCGFKAITKEMIQGLIPQIQNHSWFFDTEMLVLAANRGYRIKEIPVRWVEDPDSRVKLIRTSFENIKAIIRLRRRIKTLNKPAAMVQPSNHGVRRSV